MPVEVIEKAKYFLLDFVAVAARGAQEASSRAMVGVLDDINPANRGEVVIGTDRRAAFPYAALANGTFGHTLELDDVHNASSLHPGTVVIPAALAVTEHLQLSGGALIDGMIVGYEVMTRLGMALNPAEHYRQGFHPTGTCGVFGAAAAAARILELDESATASALGLAGSMASGSLEFLMDAAWSKRVHGGWSAYGGIMAALMAKRGITGPGTIIEGPYGFLHAYSRSTDVERLVAELGEAFEIGRCSVKPYACCRYMQAPLDGVLEIVRTHRLKPEQVDRITIGMLRAGFPVVAEPRDRKANPRTLTEAQFSMPFGAAVVCVHGRLAIDDVSDTNLEAPVVRNLMQRVECVEDSGLDARYPEEWPATVKIRTRDGRTYSTRVSSPKGDPDNPLTWDELEAKAASLMAMVYEPDQLRRIVEATKTIDSMADVRHYSRLLLRSS